MKSREFKFKVLNELNELCSLFAKDHEKVYQYKEIHPKAINDPEKLIEECMTYLRISIKYSLLDAEASHRELKNKGRQK